MQIVQSLEMISVNTDDISVFNYFKDLITKNFSKILGKKYKIFSFFEENEIPQRKYFLKLLEKKCQDLDQISDLSQAYNKTFRLNFTEKNSLKPVILVKTEFIEGGIALKLSVNERLFISYIKQYFKNHECEFCTENNLLMIPYKDESTLRLFESFAGESEHLKYCVDFDIDEKEFKDFKAKVHKKEGNKWKFNALAKLFSSYFQTLECTPEDDLSKIRQKYLILVKLYHPDFHHEKSGIEKAFCREQFEKIQIAYDNLKALYKNNA
ncbi:adenylosuccinate lyase [Campylobacter sp. MIT 99-7217]|uniref:adenylosuccinate lyase n=1 Tax=Campylobacter sp. MIT 99-7217 TaxID=535091 RepID=UPI00115BBE29|nr:adenylosuccinate lyase [Campylobacter sp. MIT 99-7217]TQR33173.1 adenylosuccinate lyase [Campylobacter sp. MIT 99-7217]